jgi:hypothetical protein
MRHNLIGGHRLIGGHSLIGGHGSDEFRGPATSKQVSDC